MNVTDLDPIATIAGIEAIVVNVSPKTNWTFIAAIDGDGAVGWGECSLNGWEELLAAALIRDIAPAAPYWVECLISEHPSYFHAIARLTRLARERGMKTAGGEMITGADERLG